MKEGMKRESGQITRDPKICFGMPRIAGTRIAVRDVIELLDSGISAEEILREWYSDLTEEDIRACIRFADENPELIPRSRPDLSAGTRLQKARSKVSKAVKPRV